MRRSPTPPALYLGRRLYPPARCDSQFFILLPRCILVTGIGWLTRSPQPPRIEDGEGEQSDFATRPYRLNGFAWLRAPQRNSHSIRHHSTLAWNGTSSEFYIQFSESFPHQPSTTTTQEELLLARNKSQIVLLHVDMSYSQGELIKESWPSKEL